MHGGRKRSFGRGSCRKRFIPQAILYHGRQQFRGKEPPWPISRCALVRTCSSFRRRFRRPCVGPASSRCAIRRSRFWWSRKPSKKLTAWKRWPARQCLVTPVADFTPARLVAVGAEGKGEALAEAALAVMAEFKPQHALVEIAPCGLPLDPDSKASLVENRDQYARAAQFFDGRTLRCVLFERVHDGR